MDNTKNYEWTDNPTIHESSWCDTDILNECLMHLKYNNNNGGGFNLFDTKVTDHILTGDELVGWALQGSMITKTYPDAIEKIKELYNDGLEIEYRGVACRRSIDGRYIADIAQKEAVDEVFEKTGIADFYILDSVNEYVYLPRNKWFAQYTLETDLLNNFNAPGLPNLDGNSTIYMLGDEPLSGCFKHGHSNSGWSLGQRTSSADTYLNLDASVSNSLYGKSDTVQISSSNKLLYYKVGNVVNNDSSIDVSQMITDLQTKLNLDLQNATAAGKSFIGSQAMPSDSYMDMTLGASEDTYIAPADGYIAFRKTGNSGQFGGIYVYKDKEQTSPSSVSDYLYTSSEKLTANNIAAELFLPIKKGNKYKIGYSLTGNTDWFRFIYAQGSVPASTENTEAQND